ncbi:MAG: UDP-glucose/iron transport system permease protein [Petroclostridium sp.]|jgi:putative ABC transport system permease protein|uniref:ABC transporter permease n=1 Tax=Petroclostridium xylanilyticum TaxID=1792311 RepID=UPI000B988C85|nr:iron export ABC transporter permease subunit FetB [Petroclostridium xylanilyticum]MDK2810804.1 UDP-glucose/iron transport system permease protein [Petroclostridium sp.]
MNTIIDLNPLQLLSAYIFVVVLFYIVRVRNIGREKEIIIASARMTIQLVLVGYILEYIFNQPNYWYTLIVISIMEIFAIQNVYKRVKIKMSKELKKIIAVSMVTGTLASLCYFLFVVIGLQPWYDPRYFVPLAGMILGNSMTGISLGAQRLIDGMTTRSDKIEMALMLGATPKAACKEVINHAFDAAIMPTVNSMVGMGIISLPGMMTGQILGGNSPIIATEYQIAIMLGILGSVSLTVILFVQLGYKTFFNDRSQLVI